MANDEKSPIIFSLNPSIHLSNYLLQYEIMIYLSTRILISYKSVSVCHVTYCSQDPFKYLNTLTKKCNLTDRLIRGRWFRIPLTFFFLLIKLILDIVKLAIIIMVITAIGSWIIYVDDFEDSLVLALTNISNIKVTHSIKIIKIKIQFQYP